MNRAQQQFGAPLELVTKKIFPVLNPMLQEFVRAAPFAVLSTADAQGNCDASPKGGRPGFVKVLDEYRLLVPDVAGNKLFQSYENLETNPKAALLFLIPGCDWTVRVNGRARVVEKSDGHLAGIDPEVFAPDENTKILQGLLLEVDEAYAQCPRAFTFSKLWDVEQIAASREAEANRYWLGRWKQSMKGLADEILSEVEAKHG
ncbi:pyridoxamine 5'-phosphate oxidase family protein [Myxococcota bacterium]|nr:pyridoxamine 5'-phosphate oxidase family protein [Myxococcota bacterium]